jgi:hypothetical protein
VLARKAADDLKVSRSPPSCAVGPLGSGAGGDVAGDDRSGEWDETAVLRRLVTDHLKLARS